MNLQPASTYLHATAATAATAATMMPPSDIPLEIILPASSTGISQHEVPQYMELSPGNYWEVIQSKWEQEEEEEEDHEDPLPPVSEIVISTAEPASNPLRRSGRRGSLVMTLKKTIMHPEDTARLRESITPASQPYMPFRKESMGMVSLMEEREEDYDDYDDYDSDYDDDEEPSVYPAGVHNRNNNQPSFRRGSLGVPKAYNCNHRKASMGMTSLAESEEDYYDTDEEDDDEEPTATTGRSAAGNFAPIAPFRRGSLVVNMAHLPPSSFDSAADSPQQAHRNGATPTQRRGSLVMSLGYEVAEPTLQLRRQVSAPPKVPYRKPSMDTQQHHHHHHSVAPPPPPPSSRESSSSSSPKYPTRKSSMDMGPSAVSGNCCTCGDGLQKPSRKPSMDHSSSTTTSHQQQHHPHSPKCPMRKASMDHSSSTNHSSSSSPTYPTRKPSMDHNNNNNHSHKSHSHSHSQTRGRRGSLMWSVAPEEPEHICLKLTGLSL